MDTSTLLNSCRQPYAAGQVIAQYIRSYATFRKLRIPTCYHVVVYLALETCIRAWGGGGGIWWDELVGLTAVRNDAWNTSIKAPGKITRAVLDRFRCRGDTFLMSLLCCCYCYYCCLGELVPYRRNIICREVQVNSYNVASSIWPCGQPVRSPTGNCPRRKPIFCGIVFSGRMSLFDP